MHWLLHMRKQVAERDSDTPMYWLLHMGKQVAERDRDTPMHWLLHMGKQIEERDRVPCTSCCTKGNRLLRGRQRQSHMLATASSMCTGIDCAAACAQELIVQKPIT